MYTISNNGKLKDPTLHGDLCIQEYCLSCFSAIKFSKMFKSLNYHASRFAFHRLVNLFSGIDNVQIDSS